MIYWRYLEVACSSAACIFQICIYIQTQTQTQNIFIENTQKHTQIHQQGWNPAGFICLSSVWFTYKEWYDLHNWQRRLVKQNRKTTQILLQVSHNRQLQLRSGNTNQLHNWRESGYITLQSSCEHFPFKQVILYILFKIGSDVEDFIWHGKEFQSFAPYSFRLNRRMSSLPYNTWRSSTFRVPCSWQSRLYW